MKLSPFEQYLLDNCKDNIKLTMEEIDELPEKDKKDYFRALGLKKETTANGPFGGWADGNEILMTLGWKEETVQQGNHAYSTLQRDHK